MFLSPKQKLAYQESNAHINIFEGPVRAGKSFISLIRFIEFIRSGPKGELVACGRNQDTLKRNFVMPLIDLLGKLIVFFPGKKEVNLFSRTIYLIGANDERATGKIQGSTFCGAWVDEVTLLPKSFWLMLLSRLSVPGAMLFGTTNPDSPMHWLKTDFIDKSNDDDYIKILSFSLDDNPSLTEKFVNNLKKSYSGLWYKRYIEGLWVLAEGSIYDFFDDYLHVVNTPPTYAKFYIMGIDYGTTNPFAVTIIGYNDDHHPTLWVEKEYYYDSRAHGRQKTDAEYGKIIQELYQMYTPRMTYVDPSAASFQVELKRLRIPSKPAINDVLDGIRFVANLMMQGDLVICSCCKNLIKEIQGYVWDEKSVINGEDKPKKVSDHLCDSFRYSLFSHFGKRHSLKSTPDSSNLSISNPLNTPNFNLPPGWRSLS